VCHEGDKAQEGRVGSVIIQNNKIKLEYINDLLFLHLTNMMESNKLS